MAHQPKVTRRRQVVVNIEDQFADKFAELAEKQGVSSSTLGRRVLIKHMMDQGILPTEQVLDTVL